MRKILLKKWNCTFMTFKIFFSKIISRNYIGKIWSYKFTIISKFLTINSISGFVWLKISFLSKGMPGFNDFPLNYLLTLKFTPSGIHTIYNCFTWCKHILSPSECKCLMTFKQMDSWCKCQYGNIKFIISIWNTNT